MPNFICMNSELANILMASNSSDDMAQNYFRFRKRIQFVQLCTPFQITPLHTVNFSAKQSGFHRMDNIKLFWAVILMEYL